MFGHFYFVESVLATLIVSVCGVDLYKKMFTWLEV